MTESKSILFYLLLQFQWVNETLDDEDEQAKENGTETPEKEAAFNPLAESENQSDERNPLGDDELDKPNERLNNPVNADPHCLGIRVG